MSPSAQWKSPGPQRWSVVWRALGPTPYCSTTSISIWVSVFLSLGSLSCGTPISQNAGQVPSPLGSFARISK